MADIFQIELSDRRPDFLNQRGLPHLSSTNYSHYREAFEKITY
ncbi:MAG: hypothetical protein QGH75_01115 [Pseudomonadales bacterium]|jgi:hypothetical protein|nr:hypothetical protein [Pseudomonadales bacterium]